jgi:hypothetical protein
MDWDRAIGINREALIRIVAALIAMVEGAAGARLLRATRIAVLRVLRPAESAVRRLIVIAARGIAVTSPALRPMPRGLAFGRSASPRTAFQLFDPRRRFDLQPRRIQPAAMPRISLLGAGPLVPLFHEPQPEPGAGAEPDDGMVGAAQLGRRLAAIETALADLPRQARRLARWRARRDTMRNCKFISPLRPGRPPGYRREAEDEIDGVLRKCHALASEVIAQDTS